MNNSVQLTTQQRAGRRRRVAGPLGAALFVFALIGLAAVVFWVTNLVGNLFDNTAQRSQYEAFLGPVVMTNPVPFSRVENVEQTVIQQSSLWAALMSENRATYAYDETGLLLVPASDVDVAAVRLFGPTVSIMHQSFDDNDASYLYDPEIAAYRVPSINKAAYQPKVEEIVKNGDSIELRVGYMAPGNIWTTDPSNENTEPVPEKYVIYVLTKWEQGYYISALRDVENSLMPRS